MAQVPYTAIPDAQPDERPPPDYQNIQPTAFEGMQKLGEGASAAGKFFGQIQTDDAINQYLTEANKVVAHFRSLNGRDALDAQDDTNNALDEAAKNARSGLGRLDQQAQFDTVTRTYRQRYFAGIMSSHADQAAKEYATKTNNDSLDVAVTGVINNPYDEGSVTKFREDARSATVRQLQIQGNENDPDAMKSAINDADRKIYTAQAEAIAVKDPQRAVQLIDAHKDVLGPYYPELSNRLRARADQASGVGAVDAVMPQAKAAHASAHPYADPNLPIYSQTATTISGGYSAHGLYQTVMKESGGNPNIGNKSDHVGLGQFSQRTWNQFGPGDRRDGNESIRRIQLLAVKDAKALRPVLGRQPTDAELYLAHNQGAGGAIALLRNPNALARDIVGVGAVVGNGGTINMTAAEFVSHITHYYNGTSPGPVNGEHPTSAEFDVQRENFTNTEMPAVPLPPSFTVPGGAEEAPPAPPAPSETNQGITEQPAPQAAQGALPPPTSVKADAYSRIMEMWHNKEITLGARNVALSEIDRRLRAEAIAADEDEKARHLANEKASDVYVKKMLTPGADLTGMDTEIANDPNLLPETRLSLTAALIKQGGADVSEASKAYGPGFWDAQKRIVADLGDPSRINSVDQIYKLAGPGGSITLAGADKLATIFGQMKHSTEDSALQAALVSQERYAKERISFQQDTGPIRLLDPEGEKLFNHRFMPEFLHSFDTWVKQGKDPWEFVRDNKTIDGMIAHLRSPREMALAKVAAQDAFEGNQLQNVPPAPEGIDPNGWKLVLNATPMLPGTNQRMPMTAWLGSIQKLLSDPSPTNKMYFDYFAKKANALTADDIIQSLTIPGQKMGPYKGNILKPFLPPEINQSSSDTLGIPPSAVVK